MLSQSEYVRLKRRLTTLENKLKRAAKADPQLDGNYCLPVDNEDDPRIPIYKKIIEEVKYALAIFEEQGYPDFWPRWRNAADDAAWQLGRFYPGYDEAVEWTF